jgi:hypothetical protein
VAWEPTGAEDVVEWEARYGVGGADGPHPAALLTRVIRPPFDPNVYGGPKGGTGSGEESFLVLLTEKSFAATFIEYAAVEVEASGDLAYAVKSGGRTFHFDEGEEPLYEENDLNRPVVGVDGSDVPNFVDEWSVVRVRQHPDGYWFFSGGPVHGIFRRTGSSNADGELSYHRINTNSGPGVTWADRREVRAIEAE